MTVPPAWLKVERGEAPLLLAFPHGGAELAGLDARFVSPWLATRDADWWIETLYRFVRELGVTTVSTRISRAVIDCNRDPSGASLYPGQATTGLCPTESFDGDPLYRAEPPHAEEIARRRATFFDPYHAALAAELDRLRALHPHVVLYDAHSIRSAIPRLFAGELPQFNIGTFDGASCDPALARAVEAACAASGLGHVVDGRFKGGWTTRHYGRPTAGIHAIQMELAMRGYLTEPEVLTPGNWPPLPALEPAILSTLRAVIAACLTFAEGLR